MEIKASIKNLRIGPRKVRLLTKNWHGHHPEKIIKRLSLTVGKPVESLTKLLKQAIANAVKVHHLENADLRVDTIQVGDSFGYKRMDRSHGARFDRGMIKKRGSNVYLSLKTVTHKIETPAGNKTTALKGVAALPIKIRKPNVNKIVAKNGSKS